jgi:adhesin transport system membrane fusion protein
VNDLKGERSSIQLSLPRVEASVAEIEKRIKELGHQFKSTARSEYNELLAEQTRLEQALSGMQDRMRRTEVRSPLKGTVKEVMVNTVDGVVKPGDSLISVVPWEDKLIVEAKLSPADIGHLRVGQKAVVKVSAYDFSIYGSAPANLNYISASTFLNEKEEAYFLVRLETENSYLNEQQKLLPLMAGMTVDVDVLTGKKTVMDYLLKPILKAKNSALREP